MRPDWRKSHKAVKLYQPFGEASLDREKLNLSSAVLGGLRDVRRAAPVIELERDQLG